MQGEAGRSGRARTMPEAARPQEDGASARVPRTKRASRDRAEPERFDPSAAGVPQLASRKRPLPQDPPAPPEPLHAAPVPEQAAGKSRAQRAAPPAKTARRRPNASEEHAHLQLPEVQLPSHSPHLS